MDLPKSVESTRMDGIIKFLHFYGHIGFHIRDRLDIPILNFPMENKL
jgi:hypothetical protein